MRVLGIDPGLTRCGTAVVDGASGTSLRAIHIGVIRTEPDLPLELRLMAVQSGLAALVDEFAPDAIAIERVFSQLNVRTAMGTAQAAAMGLLLAGQRGIPVAMHTPTEVKAAVTGNGRAEKAQVTAMITRLLRLPGPPKPADAADAVAIAICQLWRGESQRRIQRAVAAAAAR
ncbi:MAG TPA: crossover junction endodeoxyribonuclease RuvC [Candidatus Saccharimonadia bacterium]|nr:crossover junction endodeoxyribonuclease RuvC [Candidatus Saccharimonadia bacterium]